MSISALPLFEGLALVLVVVVLFLGSWRSAAIVGVVLPIPALVGMVAIAGLRWTTNPLVPLGFLLAIGVLIDDAVAVQENIWRHVELGGDRRRAARIGTLEARGTLVAAALGILPLFGVTAAPGGLSPQWVVPVLATMAVAFVVSWIVSITVHPALSARALTAHPAAGGWPARVLQRFNVWFDELADRYHDSLAWGMNRPRTVIAGAAGSLLVAVAIHASVGRALLLPPALAARKPVMLELRGDDASTLAGIGHRIADELRLVPGVTNVAVTRPAAAAPHRVDVTTIEADLTDPSGDPSTEIGDRLARIPLAPGYQLAHIGAAAQQAAAWNRIWIALGVAVTLMYLVLVAHLRSWVHPVGIVLVVPLVGAVGALVVSGSPLTLAGLAGLILAAGIAVRHAIVVVRCAGRRRHRGTPVRVALIEAARLRLRPIVVTATAITAGSMPLVANGGALTAFGIAAIGGVITGAVVVLFVVPVFHEVIVRR